MLYGSPERELGEAQDQDQEHDDELEARKQPTPRKIV